MYRFDDEGVELGPGEPTLPDCEISLRKLKVTVFELKTTAPPPTTNEKKIFAIPSRINKEPVKSLQLPLHEHAHFIAGPHHVEFSHQSKRCQKLGSASF